MAQAGSGEPMKLHTSLSYAEVYGALRTAKNKGRITEDVYFVQDDSTGSRSHPRAFEIQLGTDDKTTGPTRSRHYKNSGISGADQIWAATYDEWGWFIAEIFFLDTGAKFGPYKGFDDFNRQTADKYILTNDEGES